MDILIIPGNTNTLIFEVVCRVVQSLWPDTVGFVHVFDSHESAELAMGEKRDAFLREIFGSQLEIRTSLVDEMDLQLQIPEKISQILGSFPATRVLVDLTNGQKFVASVLYATASISRISRIYSLLPKTDFRKLELERLKQLKEGTDYEYIPLKPLVDIQGIARSSFLELVYYRDEIEDVARQLELQDEDFAHDVRRTLMHALSDYFSGASDPDAQTAAEKYGVCMASLGKMCEELAEKLYTYLVNFRGAQTLTRPDFNGYVDQVGKILSRIRKTRPPQELDPGDEKLKRLVVGDGLLEMIRIYRNLAAHPKTHVYRVDRYDAKLNLDASLLLLKRLSETSVLSDAKR